MSEDEIFEIVPKKAFEVGDVPEDMDLSKPPTSGLEYLRRVKHELYRTPEVVTVPLDPTRYNNQQKSTGVTVSNGVEQAPPGFAPSRKWQTEQVVSFSGIRKQLPLQKLRYKAKKTVKIPSIKDIKSWSLFCLGFSSWNKENTASSSAKDESSIVCEVTPDAHPPLLSVLAQLSHADIERLLSYHVRWLNEYGFSHQQGRWIYALLASLVKPLTPDACHLLRGLARACSKLRTKLDSKEHEFLKPLNLLICLVAHYFDQKDMEDKDDEEDEGNDSSMDEDANFITKEDADYLFSDEDDYEEEEDEEEDDD